LQFGGSEQAWRRQNNRAHDARQHCPQHRQIPSVEFRKATVRQNASYGNTVCGNGHHASCVAGEIDRQIGRPADEVNPKEADAFWLPTLIARATE
jgi:hypothetical protein